MKKIINFILAKKRKILTIRRYNKMIKYALQRGRFIIVNHEHMKRDIGTAWGAKYCLYCHEYFNKMCSGCPLYTEDNGCCNGLYYELTYKMEWSEWAFKSEKVLHYIKENG